MRIIDADGNALTSRIAGAYTEAAMVDGMVDALREAKREVPAYLALVQEELAARAAGTDAGVFAMPCFWSGEGKLGALPGVVATRPGFLHGKEVVEVEFNPAVLRYKDLAAAWDLTRAAADRVAEEPPVRMEFRKSARPAS